MSRFRHVYDLTLSEKVYVFLKQFLKLILLLFFHPIRFKNLCVELIGAFFVHSSIKNAKFLDSNDIYDYLIEKNKSLIRWGDGDSIIVTGFPNKVEEYNVELVDDLKRIILNYDTDKSPYLLAIPIAPLKDSFFRLFISGRLSIWYKTRYVFNKYLSNKSNYIFADAHLFRVEGKPNYSEFSKLLVKKDVILVHPSSEFFDKFKLLFSEIANKFIFVQIPSSGAYKSHKLIIEEIDSLVRAEKISLESLVVFITAGNTSRILVDKMSHNFRTYDLGSVDIKSLENSMNLKDQIY
jgi:hypothetical protein